MCGFITIRYHYVDVFWAKRDVLQIKARIKLFGAFQKPANLQKVETLPVAYSTMAISVGSILSLRFKTDYTTKV